MRRRDNLQTDNDADWTVYATSPQTLFVSFPPNTFRALTYSFVLNDNTSQVRVTRNKSKIRTGREVDDWCAEFEKLCRSRGIRVTAQRFAVYKALAEDLAHPTAESVYARLSKRLPGLSFATIYRTLQFFENEKLIRKVSSPGAVSRFDANVDPHQHLVCRVCGSLEDISIPELHSAAIPNVSGFTVEELDIRLVGRCQSCSRSQSKPQMRQAARLRRKVIT
jgi:Fur family transcriptional regulator, peroxide stress response regulator